ncbi:DoxX family membrane protein [Streptomyces sp. TRM70308]|uniref:DoxX family protein n=1 Tax=Streptomyces sp. TRM70308 TaxID=3131932 RepID=UPI003CFD59A3
MPRTRPAPPDRHRHLPRRRSSPPVRAYRPRGATVRRAAAFYQPRSIAVLRVSLGVLFCGFGILKLFPAASPAEEVAALAMTKMTGGLLPAQVSMPALGAAETLIGLALITGLLLRCALALFCAHMAGVFASLLLLPEAMWHHGTPTLEGQYVLKNLVLVAACLAVTADELSR